MPRQLSWVVRLRCAIGIALLICVGVCYTAQAAATDVWTSIGPFGGAIGQLVTIPSQPNTIFANSGQVFRSTDGGTSWSNISQGLPAPGMLVVDPQTPTTLYVGSYKGVYRSTDGGMSWQESIVGLPQNSFVTSLVLSPSTPTLLYAVINGYKVYRSDNGGDSWQATRSGLMNELLHTLVIDPQTTTTI